MRKGIGNAALIIAVIAMFTPFLGTWLTIPVAIMAMACAGSDTGLGISAIVVNLFHIFFFSPLLWATQGAISLGSALSGEESIPLLPLILVGVQAAALIRLIAYDKKPQGKTVEQDVKELPEPTHSEVNPDGDDGSSWDALSKYYKSIELAVKRIQPYGQKRLDELSTASLLLKDKVQKEIEKKIIISATSECEEKKTLSELTAENSKANLDSAVSKSRQVDHYGPSSIVRQKILHYSTKNSALIIAAAGFLAGGLAFYFFHIRQEATTEAPQESSVSDQPEVRELNTEVSELRERLARLENKHHDVPAPIAPDNNPPLPSPRPNPDVPATDQSVHSPHIHVGDRYTYETLDLSNSKLDNVTIREVISFSGGNIIQRNVNAKSRYTRILHYDPSWNLVSSGSSAGQDVIFQPPLKYFDFPLFVGKTWVGKSTKREHKTGAISTHIIRAQVVGQEKITVPAGTFETYKLVLNIEMLEGNKRTLGKDISWYAPAGRRTVRSETESQDPDTGMVSRKTIQLLSFELK